MLAGTNRNKKATGAIVRCVRAGLNSSKRKVDAGRVRVHLLKTPTSLVIKIVTVTASYPSYTFSSNNTADYTTQKMFNKKYSQSITKKKGTQF